MAENGSIPALTFDDFGKLTDQEIQMVLREVDTVDLSLALVKAPCELVGRMYENISERVGGMIKEEIEKREATAGSEEIEEVRGRIAEVINKLHIDGHITWPPTP